MECWTASVGDVFFYKRNMWTVSEVLEGGWYGMTIPMDSGDVWAFTMLGTDEWTPAKKIKDK